MDIMGDILNEVDKKHIESGGNCGLSPVQLMQKLDVDYLQVKQPLNELHAKGMIKVRKGINGYLIFKACNI
jgi:hypothetical protein